MSIIRNFAGRLGYALILGGGGVAIWQLGEYLQNHQQFDAFGGVWTKNYDYHLSGMLLAIWSAMVVAGIALLLLRRPSFTGYHEWKQREDNMCVAMGLALMAMAVEVVVVVVSWIVLHHRWDASGVPAFRWSAWWFDLFGWIVVIFGALCFYAHELTVNEPHKPLLDQLADTASLSAEQLALTAGAIDSEIDRRIANPQIAHWDYELLVSARYFPGSRL